MKTGEIRQILRRADIEGSFREGEELKKYTSLAIGGPVDIFIEPGDGHDLAIFLKLLSARVFPFRILGGGSNLLVADEGVRGIVIRIAGTAGDCVRHGRRITAAAGLPLTRLVQAAAENGLSGLEYAVGIPGTVGGAVAMNAGSRGGEIAGAVRRVRVFYPGSGVRDLSPTECAFGYRSSRFRHDGGVVLEAEFELRPDREETIRERMDGHLAWRKAALPFDFPSAGSVFKNPPGNHAGRLIEEAGLKGKRAGDAQISEKHANVIVNRGTATFSDVRRLIALARKKVKEKFGVDLELEIKIW